MRHQCILQNSEEDCGAACLATVAKHYGRTFSIGRIREAVGTVARGTSLLGLSRGAEAFGFNTRRVQVSMQVLDCLDSFPLPAIIHWKGNHWVVLYGKTKKDRTTYVIADPAVGTLDVTRAELIENWNNGTILLLEPDESRFCQQDDDEVSGFSRFFQRVLPYRNLLVQVTLLNTAIGLFSLATPLMMQILTDDVLVRGDTHLLTTVAIGVVAMNIVSSLVNVIQSFLIGHFAQRLQFGLILEYGRKLLHLPLSYFEGRRSGEVVSRLSDVDTINDLVSEVVLGLPSQFFIAVVSLCFMLFHSWQLTIASIVVFLLVTGVNLIFLPALRHKIRKSIVLETENQGFLVETFHGVQVLKTTQATPQAWQEYQTNFARLANLDWGLMKLGLFSSTTTGLFSALTSVAILWLGSHLVINQTLTIGQLLAFNGMSDNFLGFLGALVGLVDEFVAAQVIIQRMGEVIDATPENENDFKKPWAEIPATADITIRNLNFHHAGRADLLQDFSLKIPGGRVTALIGKSGCGKSSLSKLIAGLYTLQSGNIQYYLYNQQDISLDCLRQQIILVPQDAHFWSRSVIENFQFSYPNIDFEQIVKACQITGANEFIDKLPNKYQTILGEFGANLSGGQKQRLAIARAIITDPSILILDESTGALDPIGEMELLDRLLHHRQGKTTILISHRPSVICRADWVVMLEDGCLKIEGTPDSLYHQAGDHRSFLEAPRLDSKLVSGCVANGKTPVSQSV